MSSLPSRRSCPMPRLWGRNDCMTNASEHLRGRLTNVLLECSSSHVTEFVVHNQGSNSWISQASLSL